MGRESFKTDWAAATTFEYIHENGEVQRADSAETAHAMCPVLGKMALEQAQLLLEIAAIGQKKMQEDAAEMSSDEQEAEAASPFDYSDPYSLNESPDASEREALDTIEAVSVTTDNSPVSTSVAKETVIEAQAETPSETTTVIEPDTEPKADTIPIKQPITSLEVDTSMAPPVAKKADKEEAMTVEDAAPEPDTVPEVTLESESDDIASELVVEQVVELEDEHHSPIIQEAEPLTEILSRDLEVIEPTVEPVEVTSIEVETSPALPDLAIEDKPAEPKAEPLVIPEPIVTLLDEFEGTPTPEETEAIAPIIAAINEIIAKPEQVPELEPMPEQELPHESEVEVEPELKVELESEQAPVVIPEAKPELNLEPLKEQATALFEALDLDHTDEDVEALVAALAEPENAPQARQSLEEAGEKDLSRLGTNETNATRTALHAVVSKVGRTIHQLIGKRALVDSFVGVSERRNEAA